jgi:hypothetical protein
MLSAEINRKRTLDPPRLTEVIVSTNRNCACQAPKSRGVVWRTLTRRAAQGCYIAFLIDRIALRCFP